MKKHVLLTAVLSMMVAPSFAARSQAVDSEVDAEIDQMYSNRGAPASPSAGTMIPQGAVQSQPIYIMNQATPSSTAQAYNQNASQELIQPLQVQKQPTTYIEASPLKKSRADQIREARQQVEADTESKIVEKLEVSRIEDEKRRADVLFGEKFNQMGQTQAILQPEPAVMIAPVPVAPVAVTPVPVAPVQTAAVNPEDTRDVVREEIRTALDAEKKALVAPTSQKYFSGLAGVGEYPDVQNVRGNYILGASFGTKFEDAYAVEGTFLYSNFTVEKVDGASYFYQNQYMPTLVDVQQYGFAMAVKYYLLNGMVRPILGGAAQYSYRTFSWSAENYGGYSTQGGNDANSSAIDLGIVTGADFELSPRFTLGADFRYMFNLSSRVSQGNGGFLNSPAYGTPIEKLQYWNLSLAARVSF